MPADFATPAPATPAPAIPATAEAPHSASGGPLGRGLAMVCHAIRIAAVIWIGWALYEIVALWSEPARVARNYGRVVGADLAGAAVSQHMATLLIALVDWALAALVVVIVWRLFGHFLAGRILDIAAVDEMRCLGWAGVAAMLADVLARPLIAFVLSSHLAEVPHRFPLWAQPNDLLHLMMALFVVVLASVLRAGVVIAEEHRQIV